MDLDSWILFVLVGAVATVSPGPNVLQVVVHSLKYGWRRALASVAGNMACLFCVALIAALGVGAFLNATPVAYTVLKVIGAAYLTYLGVRILWTSYRAGSIFRDIASPVSSGPPPSPWRLAGEAFMVSASNSKSILFFTAVFPQFIAVDRPIVPQFAVLFATCMALVGVIHSGYGILVSYFREQVLAPRRHQAMSRLAGVAFIVFGTSLLFAK